MTSNTAWLGALALAATLAVGTSAPALAASPAPAPSAPAVPAVPAVPAPATPPAPASAPAAPVTAPAPPAPATPATPAVPPTSVAAPTSAAPAPSAPQGPQKPVLELFTPEATAEGVHVTGALTLNDDPVEKVPVTLAVDGKPMGVVTTSIDGFQADLVLPGDGKPHTLTAQTPANQQIQAATAQVPFTLALPQATVLNANPNGDVVKAGFTVTFTGQLLSAGEGVQGQEILLDIDGKTGAGAAMTDENGNFTVAAGVPQVDKETTIKATVRYPGEDQLPAASKDFQLQVVPNGLETISAEPSTEQSPGQADAGAGTTSVEPTTSVAPDPGADQGPTIASLWPLILTLGVALAVLTGIAVAALRRRRATEAEPDESLEAVSHGDLHSESDDWPRTSH